MISILNQWADYILTTHYIVKGSFQGTYLHGLNMLDDVKTPVNRRFFPISLCFYFLRERTPTL